MPGPVLLLPHSRGPHGRAVAVVEYSATQDEANTTNPSACREGRVSSVEVELQAIGFEQRIPVEHLESSTNPGVGGCGFGHWLTPFVPEDSPGPA